MGKIAGQVAKYFVGGLFIFSGLIKINDPVGFAIKLSEYFEVFATDIHPFFHAFIPLSLTLAVIICILEVILGVNLLIHNRPILNIWLLFGLIVFFTFLTFYSAYFNKVTDCGCFGDAIPLNPWQSFYKDLILLFFIVILIWRRHDFEPKLAQRSRYVIFSASLVISFFLAEICIRHLPILDFRAYKIGNNIPAMMQPSAPLEYIYTMRKDGVEEKFTTYPTDPAYEYVDMELANPEAQPKITDYSIWNDAGDYTEETFSGEKLLLIVQKIEKVKPKAWEKAKPLLDELQKGGPELMVVTSSDPSMVAEAFGAIGQSPNIYFGDATVLKTIVRSNPGYWLLKDGVVKGKWHYRDTPSMKKINKALGS